MGLVLALEALGIAPGDEVITTPMTFISTPNAALFHGAVPVFADVDPKTGLIDPDAVEAAITPRTRAVIVVHLYGQLADMRRLRDDLRPARARARSKTPRTPSRPSATACAWPSSATPRCSASTRPRR